MVWRILNCPATYRFLSTILLTGGAVLTCALSSRFVREEIDILVAQQPDYLIIAQTPVFALPPSTPLPTHTPTPKPTVKPPPLPAIRLSIPAIALNTSIKETSPVSAGQQGYVWKSVAFAVGHYNTSGNPGEGRNIVLAGHNNTQGAVFRHLSQLRIGDKVILYTADDEFHYQVQSKYLIPYLGAEAEGNAKLQSYAAPTSTEMVTMISCWPYVTNAHRIVVIAVPSWGKNEHDH